MQPTLDPARREIALRRAFLLIERRQPEAARRILLAMPRDPDVADLLARIEADKNRVKTASDHLLWLRYQFHLDTSLRRAGAYLVAIALGVKGIYEVCVAAPYASAQGLMAEITTQVPVRYSRYAPTTYILHTRPIYVDLIYGIVLTVVAVLMIAFVLRVSRGAAQWEELTPST